MEPVNPNGLKLAVPLPLSVTPVPLQVPLELVGVPVRVIGLTLSQSGP